MAISPKRLRYPEWDRFAQEHPERAGELDFSCADRITVAKLLVEHPDWLEYLQRDVELTDWDWSCILCYAPNLADKADFHQFYTPYMWGGFLEKCPNLASRWDSSAIIQSEKLGPLVIAHPEIADARTVNMILPEEWDEVAEKLPRLKKLRRLWMEPDEMVAHLIEKPEEVEACNLLVLTGAHWSRLLQGRPRLAKYCDWSRLSDRDRVELAVARPSLAKKCRLDDLSPRARKHLEMLKAEKNRKGDA